MAITPASQAGDVGSIPIARSRFPAAVRSQADTDVAPYEMLGKTAAGLLRYGLDLLPPVPPFRPGYKSPVSASMAFPNGCRSCLAVARTTCSLTTQC
jgi:hypothetical protein